MPTRVLYITDPACPASWGIEPSVRRLVTVFGDRLAWTFVMGGLAREILPGDHGRLVLDWLEQAESARMPVDPLIWRTAPLRSTYPASMAMKAATEQASDGGMAFLRALREGIFCFRRKLDTTDAVLDEARRIGLDAQRFRLDLDSAAIVEAFGNDLEIARDVPEDARADGQLVALPGGERVAFPTLIFGAEDGARQAVYGAAPYEDYRRAAEAAGAVPLGGSPPTVTDALSRFGRMATREVEEVCGLRGPRAEAELWRLATEFEVKPTRVLTGWLWELAP